MVPSEVSGILFTANPATGERSEMIVNASFGLGEAIVGGEVTPDAFIIEKDTLAVKETMIGGKEHMIVSADGQGTETRELTATEREQASLSEPLLKTSRHWRQESNNISRPYLRISSGLLLTASCFSCSPAPSPTCHRSH